MKDFIKLLQANKQYKEIIRQLRDGNDCTVNGLWGSSASFFIAALASEQPKATKAQPKLLLVVPSVEEAEEDVEDLKTFLDGHVGFFPAREDIFTNNFENEGEALAQKAAYPQSDTLRRHPKREQVGYYCNTHPGAVTVQYRLQNQSRKIS